MTSAAVVTQPWVEVAHLRQGVSRLVAGVFMAPTQGLVDELRAGAEVLSGMNVAALGYGNAVVPLLAALQAPGDLLACNVEHVRLFESGVDGALCPPVESFYRSDSVGSVIAQVQRDCRRLGLAPKHGGLVAPDHISTELEVLSTLVGAEAESWAAGDLAGVSRAIASQQWFLGRHLGKWATGFTGRLRRADPAEPYGLAGAVVSAMVPHEQVLLAALAREINRMEAAA